MIEIQDALIDKVSFHRFSIDESRSIVNDNDFQYNNEEDQHILKQIFLKPFVASTLTNEFHHEIDINLNPLFQLASKIFEGDDFAKKSQEIYTHLKTVSKHPNIKDGDLFCIKFESIKLNNGYYDALGIYKVENKDSYIEVDAAKHSALEFKKGISGRRFDKACLIIFDKKPYTIFNIDNGKVETEYWTNDFLNLASKNDSVNQTTQFLNLTKQFIAKELPSQFDVTKADQVELINKSVDFFKTNDIFDIKDFTKEVIEDPGVSECFNRFKENYQEKTDIEIPDSFAISDVAVKKQTRSMKSVIKLDKNFHIYVHGSNQYIKKGYDEATGMHYYQLFFKEEL